MAELNIQPENIYTDKQSGKDTSRPGLQKLLITVKKNDTIIVESISRFARNTRDLLDLIEKLNQKGVKFVSLKENIDTTTPTGKFMLTVFGAVAELERGYILERQKEGIRAAKMRGVRFGRPEKDLPEDFGELLRQWGRGDMRTADIIKKCNVCRSTFYAKLKEYKYMRGDK
jgi:DNA invertase Pin-like site-specific DNA recombinase